MAYNNLISYQLVSAGDISASFTSPVLETVLQDNIGIQMSWDGDPVGTFDVEVSLNHKQDAQGNVTVVGTWIPLTLSPAIAAAGTPDTAYIDLNQISAPYIRIVYTSASGAGLLDIFVGAKGV